MRSSELARVEASKAPEAQPHSLSKKGTRARAEQLKNEVRAEFRRFGVVDLGELEMQFENRRRA